VEGALQALKQKRLEEVLARREALAAQPAAREPGTFEARFVPLEPTTPEDEAVGARVARFDQEVAALNLEAAKASPAECPKAKAGEAAFVGNAACQSCHAKAFPVWEASGHAHAYATLVTRKKQFHLDCVGCHVTGMDRPGGVCRVDAVEGRKDVGCESCHGPGSLHAASPTKANIQARPGMEVCVGCHNPENSPHFDPAVYLPRILGEGHGR
jgi:predicted CXXCH cytochrome family protein